MARWNRNSSSMRASAARDAKSERARADSPLSKLISALQDQRHGGGEALPFVDLVAERPASLTRNRVVTRAAIVLGRLPVARDVAAVLEALECRIERTLIDVEAALRDLLNPEADSPAVHGREGQRLENQQIDAAAERIRLRGAAGRHERASSLEDEKSIDSRPLEVKKRMPRSRIPVYASRFLA